MIPIRLSHLIENIIENALRSALANPPRAVWILVVASSGTWPPPVWNEETQAYAQANPAQWASHVVAYADALRSAARGAS